MAHTRYFFSLPSPSRIARSIKARSHITDVDIASARDIMNRYGLEITGNVSNLTGGLRNRSLVVDTSRGRKVLKAYRPDWLVPEIIYEHSILNRLAQINFPAPRLIFTPQGNSYIGVDGQSYALLEYVNGVNYGSSYVLPSHRSRLMSVAGRTLAQFHRQLEGFMPEGQHHLGFRSYSQDRLLDLSWHVEKLTELQEKSRSLTLQGDQEYVDFLIQKTPAVKEGLCLLEEVLNASPLPRLIIHGDYGIHNLLFHRDGTVTLLDFELARLEWRLSDLVMVLSRIDFESSRSFMAAYQAEYPLTSDEWHLLPQVWKFRMLQGAVQYWNNYFELGGSRRLVGACERIRQAEWAIQNKSRLLRMRAVLPEKADWKPLRILMVTRLFYPWIGGAERQAHKLAQKLIEKDVSVELVTGWWFRKTPQREILEGVPVFRNFTMWDFGGIRGLRKFGGYLYILTLIGYLWRHRMEYDLVHVHGLNYHTFAVVLASHLSRKRVLAKLANSGDASDIQKMRQDRQLALSKHMLPVALKCDEFVAINKKIVEELEAAGVPPQKIIEIGNGVETDSILQKTRYILNDPVRLIYVGRLHEQKGLDVLLDAFQKLAHQHPVGSVRLQLLGDGPSRDALVHLATRLGISKQVEFWGETDRVFEQLLQADIFILPSRAEGLSNALLEAMACGLPVVVSNIPGNTDVVEHQVNGLLFNVNDPDSLAENLGMLIDRMDQREQLGRAARQTVESRYSLNHVADRYIALYQELLTTSALEPVLSL